MFEYYLVEHCAPTLASIKTANMFSVHYDNHTAVADAIALYNNFFAGKGVRLMLLKAKNNFALIYVYRPARLRKDLAKPGVAAFLADYGYISTDVDDCIRHLQTRLAESSGFPHEIGIFLGYPLGDVIGFIENAGQNCKCTGCWKVYCNECEAIKTFALYKKCSGIYTRLMREGRRNLLQLTVG
ncbi:MAG: DUF3793 family protein [Clostridia bacterium]|nr:DUF3793 family protein [Clostridia bacterium]